MAIEIYSKDDCNFCEQTKQLLRVHKREYIEYKLGEDFTREILLSKFPEAKTFPVVVVDGFHIGGFNDLQRQLNEQTNDTRKILMEENYYGA